MGKKAYDEKGSEYFSNQRLDVISDLNLETCNTVLDVGCGSGGVLDYLKAKKKQLYCVGVEPFYSASTTPGIDEFHSCSVQEFLAKDEGYGKSFDLIFCLDVLEHIDDYESVFDDLYARTSPGGQIVVSVPNMRNVKILYQLIFKADFPYQKEGLFDETHLRWFTAKSLMRFLRKFQFESIQIARTGLGVNTKAGLLNILTLHVFKDLLSLQNVFYLTKPKQQMNSS